MIHSMNHKLDHPRLSMALYELRLDCFDFFNPGRPRVRKYPYSNATDKKHTMQRINFYLLQLEERTSSRHSQNIVSTWPLKVKPRVTIWYKFCPWILCCSSDLAKKTNCAKTNSMHCPFFFMLQKGEEKTLV